MSIERIPLPSWTLKVRIAQFAIAGAILVLVAASLALWGGYGSFGFGLFTCIATMVTIAYWYYANRMRLDVYNRWALLVLDVLGVIWWLSTFSALAQLAAAFGVIESFDADITVATDGAANAYTSTDYHNAQISKALTGIAAALGAAEFILFLVTLITFSTRLHKQRTKPTQPAFVHGTPQQFDRNYEEMKPDSQKGSPLRQDISYPVRAFDANV